MYIPTDLSLEFANDLIQNQLKRNGRWVLVYGLATKFMEHSEGPTL
jgi:hypothetical protein